MDGEKFQEYMKDRYEPRLKRYEKATERYHLKFRIMQAALIVAAAIAPAVTAFAEFPTMRYLGVALSALVAILTSFQRALRFEDAWMNARITREDLRREKYLYLTSTSDYSRAADKETLFAERVETIIERRENAQAERLRESFKDIVDQMRKENRPKDPIIA